METTWTHFELVGRIETVKYRTNEDASVVEFWSETRVPGLARQGWNRTKSETVRIMARKALKGATHAS